MALTCENSFRDIDIDTAALIIQLQLQDAEHYRSSSKGKARVGEECDESLAFRLQQDELQNVSRFFADGRMTESIADAVQNDGQVLNEAKVQEDTAVQDGRIARRFTDDKDPMEIQVPNADEEAIVLDDELLDTLQALYVPGPDEQPHDINDDASDLDTSSIACQAESSSWAASRRKVSSKATHRCEACREVFPFGDVARVPCRHEYCRGCLETLFEVAMKDEAYFPVRCCKQSIRVPDVRVFLDYGLVRRFEKKSIEFATSDRTYCYSPSCSAFITTRNTANDVATCQDCGLRTCTSCKAEAHGGDCPNDTALQQVLETAREKGWQRCHSCRGVVELAHGCNHMICRCGAQFCYACGRQWKECNCEYWNEQHILNQANQLVDREAGAPPALPQEPHVEDPAAQPGVVRVNQAPHNPARERRVAQAMQHLRENHECHHIKWRHINHGRRCEECKNWLPQYIFRCSQCGLQACNRCVRNRL